MIALIDKLEREGCLSREEFATLIQGRSSVTAEVLRQRAVALRQRCYGVEVYLRGLIEFTNYCRNDCYYCGIRRSNSGAERYRIGQRRILRRAFACSE